MSFSKDFDELLQRILTDYRNQLPGADTSQGSLIFIQSACLASALWGNYQAIDYQAKQIFPDTATPLNLEHHAWVSGLSRRSGETDAELLARLLSLLRLPPAGGNKNDYEQWALSIDHVAAAWCFPIAQGPGTVDVVIMADEESTGSEIPSSHGDLIGINTSVVAFKLVDSAATFVTGLAQKGDKVFNILQGTAARVVSVDSETELTLDADIFTDDERYYQVISLCQEVLALIDTVRPVTASAIRVLPPEPLTQDIDITLTGRGIDTAQVAADITAWMNSLVPGQVLFVSRLIQLALDNGADNAAVTTPAADVIPDNYEMIRPGVINVA
jgi:hypothetical protein